MCRPPAKQQLSWWHSCCCLRGVPISEQKPRNPIWQCTLLHLFQALLKNLIANEVVDDRGCTSIHLECESINTRKLWPMKGPAKSRWTRAQGWVGHFQGNRGASGGVGPWLWQLSQLWTASSISWSRPGHHTNIQASLFIQWHLDDHHAALVELTHDLEVELPLDFPT